MFDWFGSRHEFGAEDAARLRRIERKLDLLLEELGIDARKLDDELPEAARPFAAAGDKLGAIRAYRRATGAGLADAKRAVERSISRPGKG